MKNTLRIGSECWPDVTEIPHFIVAIHYEGLVYECDDIYFDNLDDIVAELQELERTRQGQAVLHGGFRFQMRVTGKPSGGLDLNFKTESDATFPGKCTIEGCFSIDGEHAATTIEALVKLFQDGTAFAI